MTRCGVQGTGAIELYFYDELAPAERASIEQHVWQCAECAQALEELRVIRAALAARPDVSSPASGDWSGFMTRLESAIARQSHPGSLVRRSPKGEGGGGYAAYLAMAALLALVTVSVTIALRSRQTLPAPTNASADDRVRLKADATENSVRLKADATENQNADFAAISEEHFERSKLVVLGLATKDPGDHRPSDWAYERELASSLLNDTRMYRLAAEDRGLTNIAGVMRDLEIVLLQTSMTDDTDPSALRQIQRFIQKRDLLEKMDAVGVPTSGRTPRTKGI
jgi:Putative zinc-finger